MLFKKLKLGSIEFMVSMDDKNIERVHKNIFYRYLIRPFFRSLAQLKAPPKFNKKTSSISHDKTSVNSQIANISHETSEQKTIRKRIADVEWYHSIDLGHGVITPGQFDHRPQLPYYHLPENLKDKRILDVATFDGFWAFEFEKRGASEVVALDVKCWNDLDLSPLARAEIPKEVLEKETGIGFNIAKDILGSNVKRKIMNVYDLSPKTMGMFDIVFCSDLLLHLTNPVKALQNIHSVVSDYCFIIDHFRPDLSQNHSTNLMMYVGGRGKCVWWGFGLGCLEQMIKDAGFRDVNLVSTFRFGFRGEEEKFWHAIFKAYP